MAKAPPSFDLYHGDLIKSTSALCAMEFGAYMRLLCYQWEHGSIPVQTDARMRVCGILDSKAWDRVWHSIQCRFDVVDERGTLRQNRLHEDREKAIATWQARKEGGKKGGRPPENASKSNKDKKPQGSSQKTLLEEGRGKKEERGWKKEEVDDWVFPDYWECPELREALDSFAEMRFAINKKIKSKKHTSRIFRKFDDVEHLIYAIELCTANQWQGLKPDYRPEKSNRQSSKSRADRALEQEL